MNQTRGVVAAGDEVTAGAARVILEQGGNAYDATIAAYFAAAFAEPVLTSLGGGGFLLALPHSGKQQVYDFFVQTPRKKIPAKESDFYGITADFSGNAQQEFHIGFGSMATPGAIAGIFQVHRELGSLPMEILVEPAVMAAREGVKIAEFQSLILEIVNPIYRATPEILKVFQSKIDDSKLLQTGELHRLPEYADFIEVLAREGQRLFYEGDIAKKIVEDSKERGGHLTLNDFKHYTVNTYDPLKINYRGTTLITNPPPSSGGILIAFALKLLESIDLASMKPDSAEYITALARTMESVTDARMQELASHPGEIEAERHLLEPEVLERYRNSLSKRLNRLGSTTQISVIDSEGNLASMTSSNGEGSGYIVPGTGIVMNNMLGEEDLFPNGFNLWPEDTRITSMMAPSAVYKEGEFEVAVGSGGSNRIRSAILQVILNYVDFGYSIERAVDRSRIHYENGLLSVEPDLAEGVEARLIEEFDKVKIFFNKNLFFGGVHAACFNRKTGQHSGAGDPRRGGVLKIL